MKETKCTIGVNKASFEVYEGEIFVVMGLSGSGKSTLIRCLNRLNEPTAGKVFFKHHNITRANNAELLHTRRHEMSMVFQNFGLLPHRTVLDNATFGLELRGDSKETREKVGMRVLETVGLKGYELQYPGQMSGGMQQRIGLARALANDTDVLLMDEAFSALDPLIKSDMQDELLQIQSKLHKTIVFITHDLDEAIKIGDRIAIMKDGVIEQIGTAEEIIANPASEYIEAFTEKVDRKTIITAETLMHRKVPIVRFRKDGPKGTIRKMRKDNLYLLPVENDERKFLGYVRLKDMIKLARKGERTVEKAIITDVPSIHRDTYDAIEAYGLELKQITSSGPAMVAALEKATRNEDWIVVTGWKPHIKWTQYDLKFLEDPKGVYPTDVCAILSRQGFEEDMPEAAHFFKNFNLTEDQLYELMDLVNDKGGEAGAQIWYDANKGMVDGWHTN